MTSQKKVFVSEKPVAQSEEVEVFRDIWTNEPVYSSIFSMFIRGKLSIKGYKPMDHWQRATLNWHLMFIQREVWLLPFINAYIS